MQVEALPIPAVLKITPRRFADDRGFFFESFNTGKMADIGLTGPWIQDNQSLSRAVGTIRGLHCQIAPHAQGKLVRCLRGAVWDVAVDIRPDSSSYGQHVATVLSAGNGAQLWIPAGFLHGFCTLEPDSEIFYKVTASYDPAAERGVIWNDPVLDLPWPLDGEPLLSKKDQQLPGFAAAKGWF